MTIPFFKYHGNGNDFIIIDNRNKIADDLGQEKISRLCHRRFGIGADGFMLLGQAEGYDFSMTYYNADGRIGSMCGNGARCMVKFAYDLGIHKNSYHFTAADGAHEAELDINGTVRLKMTDVNKVETIVQDFVLNTGSPHYVKFIDNVHQCDVTREGKAIRNAKRYVQEGINVNFVQNLNDHTIYVRTYERGVEAETYSCGTGVTASALMAAHNEVGFNQVDVQTLGGRLSVEYDKLDEITFRNIWLNGPAQFVFRGSFETGMNI
jgi:diaminopimelate epimerase